MELREACRYPILALSRGGSFASKGAHRARIKMLPPPLCLQLSTLNDFTQYPTQIQNVLQKSMLSLEKGELKSSVSGMCKVFWIIEADIEDGHQLFITGDLDTLGCWDTNKAVPLFPSTENAGLWKTEIEIPSGMHFKYNYFVKRENQLSHGIVWRPGPEFSLSVLMNNMLSGAIVVRDLWVSKPGLTPPISCWTSWMDDAIYVTKEVENAGHHLSRGKNKIVQRSKMDEAPAEQMSYADVLDKEVAVSVTKDATELQQPVEEPWLYRSTLLYQNISDANTLKVLKETDIMDGVDKHKVAHDKRSVSIIVLINSSVCTMQRIAILEDGKLVELLLEPVKSNVQCDSVYLGVVTRLVPHMGGAFVDIGMPRASFMAITPNREPFTYPFNTIPKGQELNGSVATEHDTHEDVLNSCDDENAADDSIVGDHIETTESAYLVHENIDEQESKHSLYKATLLKNDTDDINNDDDTEGNVDIFHPENGHHIKTEKVHNSFQSNARGPASVELCDILQDLGHSVETPSGKSKWAHVSEGTKVIVQVIKEGLGRKGPTVTAYPTLRSRFWVLAARRNRIGVSKNISGTERTRLKIIAKALQPLGFGLTVRTVAAGHSQEELQKDLEGLLSIWKGIIEHAKSAALAADEGVEGAVPVILHRAMGQTLSVVQDFFNDKVKSMIVDSSTTYHEVTSYLQEFAPDLCDRVQLHDKRTPLFDEFGIEEEINNILSKRVPLPNGGSLVIEQTEALVSIDVNGGKFGEGASQEEAILEVNLSAAKQIARELRLRDVGGIIVVDFIDMVDEANKRIVYEEVKKAVESDRSIVKVHELSRNGLMEITRKRVRPSVSFLISEACSCCHGTGRVEALETSFSKIEHEICRMLAASDQKSDPESVTTWPRFTLKVDPSMCSYLTSGKKSKLAILSSSLKVWIFLEVERGLHRGAFEVKPFPDAKTSEHLVKISKHRSIEARPFKPNAKLIHFPVKKWRSRRM